MRLVCALVGRIKRNNHFSIEGIRMSAPAAQTPGHEVDPVEAIVPLIPFVLPVVGGVLIFLLAFIAVSMA